MIYAPINEKALNADELVDLTFARTNGISRFTVPDDDFGALAQRSAAEIAAKLAERFVIGSSNQDLLTDLENFIEHMGPNPEQRLHAVKRAAATLMQAPEYQLC
jgi:hypothetical protein